MQDAATQVMPPRIAKKRHQAPTPGRTAVVVNRAENAGTFKRRSMALTGVTLVGSLLATSCIAKQAPAANRLPPGRAIYQRYCRQCHARFTLMSKELHRSPGFEELYETVRDGRPGTPMFGFGASLTEPELEAVVRYVQQVLEENSGN